MRRAKKSFSRGLFTCLAIRRALKPVRPRLSAPALYVCACTYYIIDRLDASPSLFIWVSPLLAFLPPLLALLLFYFLSRTLPSASTFTFSLVFPIFASPTSLPRKILKFSVRKTKSLVSIHFSLTLWTRGSEYIRKPTHNGVRNSSRRFFLRAVTNVCSLARWSIDRIWFYCQVPSSQIDIKFRFKFHSKKFSTW